MQTRTFDPGKPLLRGNLHTHTTVSDGGKSPRESMEWYRAQGYDFLAITDHWHTLNDAALPGLLVIPGIELDGIDPALGMFHMVGLNVHDMPRRDTIRRLQDAVSFMTGAGGMAVLCHPYWCGMASTAVAQSDGIVAMEVFNSTCEVLIAKGLSSVHWDDALARGKHVWATAVDDTHWHYPDYGGGWVMVQAGERTVEAVLAAVAAGRFYASQGPEIADFWVEDGQAFARTSPARRIAFISDGSHGACRRPASGDEAISSAYAPLEPTATYIRLEVDDAAGKRAWSNPIFLRG
ncbi:MAG: CehA/McbA family metallohydrolase [Anaerolineae bacterium]